MTGAAQQLVHARCNGCGHAGFDTLPVDAHLHALRCPKCGSTDSTGAPATKRALSPAERDLVRWLARESLANWRP